MFNKRVRTGRFDDYYAMTEKEQRDYRKLVDQMHKENEEAERVLQLMRLEENMR